MHTKNVVFLLLTISILVLTSCGGDVMPVAKKNQIFESPEERGKYLVTVLGCHDCHSPKILTPQGPKPDPQRLLSGHPSQEPIAKIDTSLLGDWIFFNPGATAFVGPWGVSYASNISSDITGIGSWTEQQFFTALKKGKYKGLENSRPLLPPMPWFNYVQAKDEDLKAIFAYLKSTKPVSNVVPGPKTIADLK